MRNLLQFYQHFLLILLNMVSRFKYDSGLVTKPGSSKNIKTFFNKYTWHAISKVWNGF